MYDIAKNMNTITIIIIIIYGYYPLDKFDFNTIDFYSMTTRKFIDHMKFCFNFSMISFGQNIYMFC